ncbi:unnamed protein product, partial [Urochloa humidicola]
GGRDQGRGGERRTGPRGEDDSRAMGPVDGGTRAAADAVQGSASGGGQARRTRLGECELRPGAADLGGFLRWIFGRWRGTHGWGRQGSSSSRMVGRPELLRAAAAVRWSAPSGQAQRRSQGSPPVKLLAGVRFEICAEAREQSKSDLRAARLRAVQKLRMAMRISPSSVQELRTAAESTSGGRRRCHIDRKSLGRSARGRKTAGMAK